VNISGKQIHLDWIGPYSIHSPELYAIESPGVYLFTVKSGAQYHPHYIGKTGGSLSNRIVGGHRRDAASGRYYIYSPAALSNLKLESVYSLKDNYFKFFDSLAQYQQAVREYLETLQFFVAPFESNFDLIETVESLLIHYAFSCRNADASTFPILDNSNRVTSSIYGSELTLDNIFPQSVSVAHFSSTISAPNSR